MLSRYLDNNLSIQNPEFSINYQDNSGGLIPGPSDWDNTEKVPPEDQWKNDNGKF